jgi:hypothetical protein
VPAQQEDAVQRGRSEVPWQRRGHGLTIAVVGPGGPAYRWHRRCCA